ncbi:alpha/beta fold hydrolase [Fibrivirga algicola]|uniref:Alpha/beta hydrolase n=1 Tax=Fibrivirga algicola TaxID=2950420 RepID=A0ABX0QSV6_9BACT|nr:alpha/beta hydrolase [Fibrivirga algicola]NID13244.1 alpha/beta hydrolase [Fibrivirga algicola]
MKSSWIFFVLLVSSLSMRGQSIPYGNNVAAGRYQSVNGIRLYYETYGKGKPLLLIHGNGGSISSFSKTIPYFARNYRVIAVDSRAHGKSVDPGDSLSFELMADDFAALLTSLKIDSAYVIGWSDGGINALLLAMRHPEKVKKLVSTGANLWPDSTALVPSLWNQMHKGYLENKDKPRTGPKEKNDWKVFVLDVLHPNIPLQALQAIKSPSLIIAGDRDVIATEHTVAIAQNVPNSWLWIVPNCGHATLIDRAAEFNNKVSEFFRFK